MFWLLEVQLLYLLLVLIWGRIQGFLGFNLAFLKVCLRLGWVKTLSGSIKGLRRTSQRMGIVAMMPSRWWVVLMGGSIPRVTGNLSGIMMGRWQGLRLVMKLFLALEFQESGTGILWQYSQAVSLAQTNVSTSERARSHKAYKTIASLWCKQLDGVQVQFQGLGTASLREKWIQVTLPEDEFYCPKDFGMLRAPGQISWRGRMLGPLFNLSFYNPEQLLGAYTLNPLSADLVEADFVARTRLADAINSWTSSHALVESSSII